MRGDHRPNQLISVATDGETFGHHRHGAEKTLAYAVTKAFPQQGWTVSNYAHYLHCHPPTWEVILKPVTAWSCAHGVDRWQDDCGCGGGGGWHQRWRRPLRDTLDWLRDQLASLFEEIGSQYFSDAWATRDNYIHVIHHRSDAVIDDFFAAHQCRPLSERDRVDALRLLDMQHHALLMYTSCGWFFEELSRPEGTQILRYAARAIQLAGEVSGIELESEFVRRLSAAPSNVGEFQDGAGVYHQLVAPSQVGLEQVAAHYAMSSLFTTYRPEQRLYAYTIRQQDYQLQRMGPLSLAVGQLQITAEVTRDRTDVCFAVLHLGGWDFHCCVMPFRQRLAYRRAKDAVFAALAQASAAQTIVAINKAFGQALGNHTYSLQNLFVEERHRIMGLLSRETLQRLDQLYSQVYRDNYGLLRAFYRDGIAAPQELQVAAEVAIGHRALEGLRSLETETSDPAVSPVQRGAIYLGELEAIAHEASQFNCRLSLPTAAGILEPLIRRALWQVLQDPNPDTLGADVDWLCRLMGLSDRLGLGLSMDRAQELYWHHLNPWLQHVQTAPPHQATALLKPLVKLGRALSIDVDARLRVTNSLMMAQPQQLQRL